MRLCHYGSVELLLHFQFCIVVCDMSGVLKRPASAASKCDRSLGHGSGPTLSELRAMHITQLRHHAGLLGVRIYEADGSKPPKKRRKDEMLKDIEHKLEHAASLDAPGTSSHGYPSVGDFERITPIEGFRATATSLGLEVSRGGKNRSKKDIVADYQQKLNDLRSEALGSDASSSSPEKAAGSPSSLSVAVQRLEGTTPGASASADLFSSEESSSSGSLRCYVCNIPVKTGVPCGKHSDCPHVACTLRCMLKLEMMWIDIKSGGCSLGSGGRHVVNSASGDGLETSDVSSRPDDVTFSSSQSSCSSANAGIAVSDSCSSSSTCGVRKTCPSSNVDRVEPRADSLEQAQYLVAAAASLAESRGQQCGASSLVSETSEACEERMRMTADPSSCAGSSCAVPPSAQDVQWLRSAISQLEGKSDITSFRAKVCDLGLVGHIPKGVSGAVTRRSKKAIIDDLKHRLACALCVHSDLLTHGVSVQSGPCQCSQEDSAAGAFSQDTVSSNASEVKQRQLRRDRQARKTYSQSAKGKFAKQVSNKKQRQRLQYKEYDKNRKQQPQQKEKDIARLGTEHEKQKARARMSTVKKTVRRCHKKQKVDVHSHTERVYANRVHFTVENGGTWRETAERLAKAEGVSTENYPVVMPPSFAGLHNTKSLKHISEMFQYFEQTTWPTCVGCWRGWYHVPDKFSFGMVKTKAGGDKQWYQPGLSTLLRFIQSSLNTLGRHL